jgi:hypothetical protein
LKDRAYDLFTPVGLVHVQYPESNHAIVRRHREKGRDLPSVPCVLGECLGLLVGQQLQLAHNGRTVYPQQIIAGFISKYLGFEYQPPPEEELEKSLHRRLQQKIHRATAEYKEARKQKRIAKHARTAAGRRQQSSGSYQTGGVLRDVAAAEEVEGGGGGGGGKRSPRRKKKKKRGWLNQTQMST